MYNFFDIIFYKDTRRTIFYFDIILIIALLISLIPFLRKTYVDIKKSKATSIRKIKKIKTYYLD